MPLTFPRQALSGQGRSEDAIASFEQANRAAPNRSEARQAIALLRQGIGRRQWALHAPAAGWGAETPPLLKRPLWTVLEGR